jgi:hypothetical protein
MSSLDNWCHKGSVDFAVLFSFKRFNRSRSNMKKTMSSCLDFVSQ